MSSQRYCLFSTGENGGFETLPKTDTEKYIVFDKDDLVEINDAK